MDTLEKLKVSAGCINHGTCESCELRNDDCSVSRIALLAIAEIDRLRAELAAYREREDRGTEAWAVFDGDGKAQASTIKKYAHSVRLSAYLKEKKGYSVRRVRITEVTDEANQ